MSPLPWLAPDVPAAPTVQLAVSSVIAALAILVAAWLFNWLVRRALDRLCRRYDFAPAFAIGTRRAIGFLVYTIAFVAILQRLGVSGSALWGTLTGFVAVGAVAFFAAWSVLSNIFCTLLILTTRPFRLDDRIELLENGEKPGLKGRVVDINFVYTTLHETREDGSDTVLQIPNSQFFQKITRRWRGSGTARG